MSYVGAETVHDADAHLMELPDFLSRHAPRSMRDELAMPTWAMDYLKFEGMSEVSRTRKHVGAHLEKLLELGDGLVAGPKGHAALGAFDPAERKVVLDRLGFASQLLFSTFSAPICFAANRPSTWRYQAARAHNEAMAEFCSGEKRLRGVALLPLDEPERALKEIDFIAQSGLSAAWVPGTPCGGRSPGHTEMDPVWAKLADNRIPFVLHIGSPDPGVDPDYMNNGRSSGTPPTGGGEIIRSKDMVSVHAPFEAFVGALVLDGVLERHPTLRGGVIEGGAGWAPDLLRRLDWIVNLWKKSEPALGEFSRKPSQQIIEQMIFTPFAYEDVAALIQQSDPRLYVFSSDYPHVEGGRAPYERFKKNMGPLPESDQTRFFATNFAEMFAA